MTQPAQQPEESLWTANDVASYLKVSRSWVYHRAEAGELPYVRVGGLLRFVPAAIREHAETGGVVQSRAKTLSNARRALPSSVKG